LSANVCDCAMIEPCVPWLNVVWAEPSPQLTSTDHGLSAVPGSLNEPSPKLWLSPSFELWSLGAVTVGATLVTTTLDVYSVKPPSLSMIRPRTVYVPLSLNVHCVDATVPELP